jgi:glycosyltransferase involved in cell wall biosynthesis
MRKLLLISYPFPPDNTPAAIRPGQLYDYLPEFGYRPIVTASSIEGSRNSEPSVHRVPTGRETRRTRFASALAQNFMRFAAPYNDRLAWAPYAAAAGAKIIREERVDAVFSTSPFLASHIAALQLKSKFGLPWIADFQDPIRDNPFRTRSWPYPYDALLERRLFSRADCLLANTDTVADVWRERYPQWAPKISILWNSFDPRERIGPGIPADRSNRILAHVGTLYGERHPGRLLSALDRLKDAAPGVLVKLVGPIEPALLARHRTRFESLQGKHLLELYNKLVSREQSLQEMISSDYLLLLDINENNAAFQVPSKLLDYIRIGHPILAYTLSNSPVAQILGKSNIPHATISPTDPEPEADRKLLDFLKLPAGTHEPSQWFKDNFSAPSQARTVAGLLDSLVLSFDLVKTNASR